MMEGGASSPNRTRKFRKSFHENNFEKHKIDNDDEHRHRQATIKAAKFMEIL